MEDFFDSDDGKTLINDIIDWCAAKGLQMGADSSKFIHCPISIFPSKIPRTAFDFAYCIAELYNTLVDRIARNPTWLIKTLAEAADADDFTKSLLEILKVVESEGISQQYMLGINRSDYMIHEPSDEAEPKLLQVELNTIASSFGSLSTLTSKLHRYLLSRHKEMFVNHLSDDVFLSTDDTRTSKEKANGFNMCADNLPQNDAIASIVKAIAKAYELYCSTSSSCDSSEMNNSVKPQPVVVFCVQAGEKNSIDQRLLELSLWEDYGITVKRYTLEDIHKHGNLHDTTNVLLMGGYSQEEVAVVYFRSGYSPSDYPEKLHWKARLMVERSLAIKCPSIAYHLVGAKKVQQVLAAPKALHAFLTPVEANILSASFAGLWELGDRMGPMAVDAMNDAVIHPERYVLKPQREGGGNNIYGSDITKALKSMTATELNAYILMERIFPKKEKSALLRYGKLIIGDSIGEFGVYATSITNSDGFIMNEVAGHMIRTKFDNVDEGGVATGYAVMNSPILY